jgi:hypothetical protein
MLKPLMVTLLAFILKSWLSTSRCFTTVSSGFPEYEIMLRSATLTLTYSVYVP